MTQNQKKQKGIEKKRREERFRISDILSPTILQIIVHNPDASVRVAQLVRSLTANQEVLGSISGLVEG